MLERAPGTITSWWRTPERNAEVGGVPNSKHLVGLAVDVVPRGLTNRAFVRIAREWGFVALDEGDHVHVQV